VGVNRASGALLVERARIDQNRGDRGGGRTSRYRTEKDGASRAGWHDTAGGKPGSAASTRRTEREARGKWGSFAASQSNNIPLIIAGNVSKAEPYSGTEVRRPKRRFLRAGAISAIVSRPGPAPG